MLAHLITDAATLIAQGPWNPAPEAPPGLQEVASQWISYLKWGGIFAGIMGLMICGIMMMIGRKDRSRLGRR